MKYFLKTFKSLKLELLRTIFVKKKKQEKQPENSYNES